MSELVQIRALNQVRRGAEDAVTELVDGFARRVRYVRISLTDRCNYRCTYCMPDVPLQYGLRADILSFEEIERLCVVLAKWGVERVRLTGGEPTLRRDLPVLVKRLRQIPTDRGTLAVALTTNGEKLEELAPALHAAGLSSLNVSVDTLEATRFVRITRRGSLARVLAGIEAARAVGIAPIKLNTVAIRGFNDDELLALVRFGWDRDLLPRFIELMPMADGRLFVPGELLAAAEIRSIIARELGAELVAETSHALGVGPATYHRVASGPYAGARFGTIAAMTENFCSSCNRLRISATGQLQGCLARDDGGDLRRALRSNDPMRLQQVVQDVLATKRERHGFELDGSGGPHKAMVSIGG